MAELKKFGSQMERRTFVAGALATGALVALAGCGKKGEPAGGTAQPQATGQAAAAGASKGGTFKFYINNPASIDPFNAQETEGMQVVFNVFDALTIYNFKTKKLEGLACESWEANDKGDVFTFHLRKGAKFHNGDPVTSKDFKFAWERICNPKTSEKPSVISYHLSAVKGYEEMLAGTGTSLGVECPDDNTLVVNLSSPYADFPYVVSHPALSPVPSGGAASDFKKFNLAPVGNGPFKMDGEWVDGQYIRVKRFDDYYGEKAHVDGVDFMIFKDPQTAFTEFQAGNLDFCQIPTGQMKAVEKQYGTSDDGYTINPGKQSLFGPETSTYYLACNVKDKVIGNVDVRKGISHAINRQAICDTIYEGTREPADGIIPPGIVGFAKGAWADSVYDVEKAKAAFDKAGYPLKGDKRELTFKLSVNSGGDHEKIMELVQGDLKTLGVEVEIETQEWAAYLEKLQAGDYQVGRLGWVADYPIYDNFLFPLFYTDNGDNRSQYSNKAVDEALMEARKIVKDDERVKALQKVDKMISEDMPVIPIVFYRHVRVGSKRVNNFFFTPLNLVNLAECWLSE